MSLKYSNSIGTTDFRDDLTPDHEVEENLLQPVPIGDLNDPLLAKAVELITGQAANPAKAAPRPYQNLADERALKLENILKEVNNQN